MEAIFFKLIVDAYEGRDVATFDVPGAYLHLDMPKDKRILMDIRGYCFDIMCQFNPEYEQHVSYENGKNVLYILVHRASCGCIESALLCYNILCTTIEGLSLN